MKNFQIYFGAKDVIGTCEITTDPDYHLVLELVTQLRNRLLMNQALRQPLLHLFEIAYEDNSKFPEHLKDTTPVADQIPNQSESKIREIRTQRPSDDDVVDFLENHFPNLYLELKSFRQVDIQWDSEETITGRESSDEEHVTVNICLVQYWIKIAREHTATASITGVELAFLFTTVFLHKLAHASLFWYGKGSCDSPRLGGIDGEAGDYYEKSLFGGVTSCEVDKENNAITKVEIYIGDRFYTLNAQQATDILKFDISGGLPLTDKLSLSPAPPSPPTTGTFSKFRAKFSHSRSKTGFMDVPVEGIPMKDSSTHFYTTLKGDKKRRLPKPTQP